MRTVLLWMSISLAILSSTGCGQRENGEPRERPRYVVDRRNIVEVCREDGLLSAVRSVAIYPGTSGERLLEIAVREGDLVEKGDLLFRYETNRIDRSIRELQATLTATRLRREALGDQLASERLEARQALMSADERAASAALQLVMRKRLVAGGLASTNAMREAKSAAAVAELALEAAQGRVDQLEDSEPTAQMATLDAELLRLEHQLTELEKRLDQCTGKAPFSGRVVTIHELVRPLAGSLDEIQTPLVLGGGPLMTVADTAHMRVTGQFFESDIARIRTGQPVRVTVPHAPGRTFDGQVRSIGQEGRSYGHTATVAVEVEVENSDDLLKPGLSAEMGIVVGQAKGAVAVPVEFLRREDDRTFVLREGAEGEIQERSVEVGLSDGRFIEIHSGLAVGDTIVME